MELRHTLSRNSNTIRKCYRRRRAKGSFRRGLLVGSHRPVLSEGATQAGIVRYARRLPFNELAEESELDIVRHDVGGALNFALLHEHFKMGHDLVLELLEPLVQLHVVLVRACIVVLPATRLAPVRLRELKCTSDFGVECAIPIARLTVELDGEHAGLHAELEETAALGVGRAENTLLSLVAPRSAAGDVAELWPGEIVGQHWRGGSGAREDGGQGRMQRGIQGGKKGGCGETVRTKGERTVLS